MLGSFAVTTMIGSSIGIAVLKKVEELKSVQTDLTEQMKQKILDEGLYHITTKEKAQAIVDSGFFAPTQGVLDNHFSKSRDGSKYADFVYMFAGKPDKYLLSKNTTHMLSGNGDGTYYAVKHKPDKFELENYTQRLQDGAITYEGKLDIKNSHPEIVRLKIEKGKIVEIPLDEKVKPLSKPKKIIRKTIGKIQSYHSTGKEISQAIKHYFDRDEKSKLRECKTRRREENKILNQFNKDKVRKVFELENAGIQYTLSTGDDKVIDGRILSEFELSDLSSNTTRKVYMDRINLNEYSEDKMNQFLTQHINFDLQVSQYIGKPQIVDGQVNQEIDEEFQEHFAKKQEAQLETNPIYEQLLKDQRSKRKLEVFKSIYNQTSAKLRKQAMQMITIIKENQLKRDESVNQLDEKQENGER